MLKLVSLAAVAALALSGCCSVPSYTPSFWNDGGTIQHNNNCYNYSNNVRTDTFAQPGQASGNQYSHLSDCSEVSDGADTDGVEPWSSPKCDNKPFKRHTKIALVLAPDYDYHWYRRDKSGMWSHKPGGTKATDRDNSNNPIANPETADRGPYTVFCGYFCSCSSSKEGAGHEVIQ